MICPTCKQDFSSYPEFTAHIGTPTCANEIIAAPDVRGVQVDNPCANHCGHGGDWITQGRCLAPVAIPDGDGEMEQVPCGHVCVLSPAEVCDNEWHGDAKTSACSGCGMSVADVMPSPAETVAIIETQRQE